MAFINHSGADHNCLAFLEGLRKANAPVGTALERVIMTKREELVALADRLDNHLRLMQSARNKSQSLAVWADDVLLIKNAAKALRLAASYAEEAGNGAEPFGWWHAHLSHAGMFSRSRLTQVDIDCGWTETPLYALSSRDDAESDKRTAPASCPNCYNESDCSNVDICNAVEEVYRPSEAPSTIPADAVGERLSQLAADIVVSGWMAGDHGIERAKKEAEDKLLAFACDEIERHMARQAASADVLAMKEACKRLQVERRRQIGVEGWGSAHDDTHSDGQLFRAGMCYLSLAVAMSRTAQTVRQWAGLGTDRGGSRRAISETWNGPARCLWPNVTA